MILFFFQGIMMDLLDKYGQLINIRPTPHISITLYFAPNTVLWLLKPTRSAE